MDERCTYLILVVAIVVMAGFSGRSASPPPHQQANASERVHQTLQGLMAYYWNHDPHNENISFFFACGQVGGQGSPATWNKCSCYDSDLCLNCYRWWDAVSMETLASYGLHANTSNHSDVPDVFFTHSPYNGDWDGVARPTFIDDFAWYGIAYLRVYDWLKEEKWLNRSLAIYEWVWKFGWDDPCGGFWWCTWPGENFKDSVTIMEMLHFSAKLAHMFPKNTSYLQDAEKIWDWIFSFSEGRGFVTKTNLFSTGVSPEKCCNSTSQNPAKKCHVSNLAGTSYNQGLFLSASAYLYSATEDRLYLDTGTKLLNAVLENYITPEGVLLDEMRSSQTFQSQCVAGSDPGGDWYSFNGIFILHLTYFAEVLAAKDALGTDQLARIKKLVQVTSDTAWNKSALWPPFNKANDACNTGYSSEKSSTYPKFHWWWSERVTRQIIPPDAGLYFEKTGLRCVGNNTQLWYGTAYSQDECEKKCTKNKHCSKYLFSTDEDLCWTWSFNRTEYVCNHTDRDFNVAIKRPIGAATCKGHCGSHEPLKVTNGMCYCDANCTHHLDCCLDYADECTKQEFYSCKGLCGTGVAQAIPGGGYCWCLDGCNPQFTDNNSMGSCCPDYSEQCLKVDMPDCLDARSQGSALNLFLGHLKISTLK